MRRLLAALMTLTIAAGCASVADHPAALPRATAKPDSAAPAPSDAPKPVVAKVSDVVAAGPAFGISLADRTEAGVKEVAAETGCRPRWVEFFASVPETVSTESLSATPGTPIVSLEPWHPGGPPGKQDDFRLQDTIAGKWDAKYEQIARNVVRYRDVVMIRFAHEMNGTWYPWGPVGTNTPALYIAAWKHVVNLFRKAGATNVLWIWSPNIIRGVKSKTIKQWWPGDEWVDFVGFTGYGVMESHPKTTFAASLELAYQLTDKPIILTETGAQTDRQKRAWITEFGNWLRANPRIAGFVWMQRRPDAAGVKGDWRYDDTAANLKVFKTSLTAGNVTCAR